MGRRVHFSDDTTVRFPNDEPAHEPLSLDFPKSLKSILKTSSDLNFKPIIRMDLPKSPKSILKKTSSVFNNKPEPWFITFNIGNSHHSFATIHKSGHLSFEDEEELEKTWNKLRKLVDGPELWLNEAEDLQRSVYSTWKVIDEIRSTYRKRLEDRETTLVRAEKMRGEGGLLNDYDEVCENNNKVVDFEKPTVGGLDEKEK